MNIACPLCTSGETDCAFVYAEPPEGENRFDWIQNYYREFYTCQRCHHYFARHDIDLSRLYEGAYGEQLYDGERMFQIFSRINGLPPERSDNLGRVAYLADRLPQYLPPSLSAPIRLLDVGSGLGVFPYRAQQAGWQVTALDPDPRAVEHICQHAGVAAICGDFLSFEPEPGYDCLSFNKVLEHVVDPVSMLARALQWLRPAGLVYVELPDGEAAATAGSGREEFFLEHYHAFSATSFALLIQQAGFMLLQLERLQEPSGKYTLRGLCRALNCDLRT